MGKLYGNVIIMRFSALGDVAMTIPAVYSVCQSYPDFHFHYYTSPAFIPMFLDTPDNLTLHPAQVKGTSVLDILRLAISMSSLRPVGIVDLHNVPRTWIVDLWFLLRFKKVGIVRKRRIFRKYYMRHKLFQQSFFERFKAAFFKVGFGFEYSFVSFAGRLSASPFPVDKHAVGIAPFARFRTKIYPEVQMERVIEILDGKGFKVILFGGGKREIDILENWAAKYPNCISIGGKYTLDKEMAVMSKLGCMLSMDSANQHIASLTGIPVITIWGGTSPTCGFMPWRQDVCDSLVSDIACSPCSIAGSATCCRSRMLCFRSITPEMIVASVLRKLDGNSITGALVPPQSPTIM